jgi:hypothetical protein
VATPPSPPGHRQSPIEGGVTDGTESVCIAQSLAQSCRLEKLLTALSVVDRVANAEIAIWHDAPTKIDRNGTSAGGPFREGLRLANQLQLVSNAWTVLAH